MGLFKKKNKNQLEVPKNELAITGKDTPKGTEVNIFVHDNLTNRQFIKIMFDVLLNIIMDLITRYNLDVNEVLENLNQDVKRTHHNYIQSMGESENE